MNPQAVPTVERAPKSPPPPPPAVKRRGVLPRIIFFCVLAIAAVLAWRHWGAVKAFFSPSGAATGRQFTVPIPPVVAAVAKSGDIHVYLEGLGYVTPLDTVSIKTQVNGQIMKIFFKEGQTVHVNDPLFLIDPRPYQADLDSARGSLARDQAILANARVVLKMYQDAPGGVSAEQIATQQSMVDQYVGIVQSDQAQIDTYKLDLVYCHINSPITGRIGLQQVFLGNFVQTSDTTPLAVITQMQPITVVFALPESDLPAVMQNNGGVGLPVVAFDSDDTQQLAAGVVSAVDNQVNVNNGCFQVKADFQNEDNLLFPNQFVNAHILVRTLKNTTVVPVAAVQIGPDNSFVYVVSPKDQTVHIHPVQVGPSEDDLVSVQGINPGDVVVTDGTDKLQDGVKVVVSLSGAGAATQPSTQPTAHRHHRAHPETAPSDASQESGGGGGA